MYGKPQLVAFTRLSFCQEWLHQFRYSRVQSVLDYPPPHSGPLFWFLSKDPYMESPNQYRSQHSCFARNGIGCVRVNELALKLQIWFKELLNGLGGLSGRR